MKRKKRGKEKMNWKLSMYFKLLQMVNDLRQNTVN